MPFAAHVGGAGDGSRDVAAASRGDARLLRRGRSRDVRGRDGDARLRALVLAEVERELDSCYNEDEMRVYAGVLVTTAVALGIAWGWNAVIIVAALATVAFAFSAAVVGWSQLIQAAARAHVERMSGERRS
jgi:hypothetical protein